MQKKVELHVRLACLGGVADGRARYTAPGTHVVFFFTTRYLLTQYTLRGLSY